MAEFATLIGVAAAAAQFTQVGCSVLLLASTLCSRFQNAPQCLQRALDQIQLLLHLAELISKQNAAQGPAENAFTSPQSPPRDGLSSSSWLETVWKNCTTEAKSLENVINSMLREKGDSNARRVWKKILTVKREESILQSMNEIERYKSMLNLWFGQACLENTYSMKRELFEVQGIQLTQLVSSLIAVQDFSILNPWRQTK